MPLCSAITKGSRYMARAATATKATAADVANVGMPTEEPLKITREDIYNAALWIARNTNRVPTLIGPTASGKTYGVGQIAERINAEVVTILLGQHTPDEVAGFQLALDGQLVVQMPYWFREAQAVLDRGKSVILLFDELGLSREETRGALYTFFRDRHLHGHRLAASGANEVLVFSASNPAVFAPPFRSRCLFLPVPADRNYLLNIAKGTWGKRVLRNAPISFEEDPFYSNAEPPPPVVVDASAAAVMNAIDDASTGFWRMERGAYMSVLISLLPTQVLNEVLKDKPLDASELAKNYEMLTRALRAMPRDQRHTMISNVLGSFPALDKDIRASAMCAIQDVIYDDETTEDLLLYFQATRPDEVVESVADMDADTITGILKERDLLYVTTNRKGDQMVAGTMATRVQAMADWSAKHGGNTGR